VINTWVLQWLHWKVIAGRKDDKILSDWMHAREQFYNYWYQMNDFLKVYTVLNARNQTRFRCTLEII